MQFAKKFFQNNYLLAALIVVVMITMRINPIDILNQGKKVVIPSAKNAKVGIYKTIGTSMEVSIISWMNLYYPIQNPNCNTKCQSSCPKASPSKKFSRGQNQLCITDKCHCNALPKNTSKLYAIFSIIGALSVIYLAFIVSLDKKVVPSKSGYEKIYNEESTEKPYEMDSFQSNLL